MSWLFGNRRTRGSVSSRSPSWTDATENVRRRSLKETLIPSFNPPGTKTSPKRSGDTLGSDPTAQDLPQTPGSVLRELKNEAIVSPCRGQIDLETELQELRKTVAEQDAKIKYYESESYKKGVSVHQNPKVAEEQEPWRISQKFGEITTRVEDISGELSELLLSLQPVCQPTARNLFEGLYPLSDSRPPANHISRYSVRPEEYIDFGCRALISRFLMDNILNEREFHASLSSEENQMLYSRYQKIRMQDPQAIAGQWRVSTIKSLGESRKDHAALAQWLCQEVLAPFCCNVYNLESSSHSLESITPELAELLRLASEWRSFTESSVLMYDFHPRYLEPGAEFVMDEVEVEGIRANEPFSNRVFLTSRLGLASSRALGESQGMESAIQSKVGVLTSEYFAAES